MAARKKKTSRKVATRPTNDLALAPDLQDMFADSIKRDRATSKGAGGWPFVKTSGAWFEVEGTQQPDPFRVVAVAAVRQNTYYQGVYDPNNPASPVCYAIDADADELTMAPPPDLPGKQADRCSDCPNNAFGSAGKGKACKNGVKVALLRLDMPDLAEGAGAILNISPTALKPWGTYVARLNDQYGRPIFCAETIFEKDDKKIVPKLAKVIDDPKILKILHKRAMGDILQVLLTPPPTGDAVPDKGPKKKRRRRVAKS